jgi:hypothetical protein
VEVRGIEGIRVLQGLVSLAQRHAVAAVKIWEVATGREVLALLLSTIYVLLVHMGFAMFEFD